MHPRHLPFLLLLLGPAVRAQETAQPTGRFTVTGAVRDSATVTLADLKRLPVQRLGNLTITDHQGGWKRELRGLEGVTLKSVLERVPIATPSARALSEFYFVCKAADGSLGVYSWSELFNTPVGDRVFVITAYEGHTLATMPERIMLVSATDFRTGRRNLQNLVRIEVQRAR